MCEYVFNPEDCVYVTPIHNDPWCCPRDTIGESNKCEYHADASQLEDDLTEKDVFKSLVEDDMKIYGARFQSLEITDSDIEGISADSIDIYNAEFGRVEIKNAELYKKITFWGCEFGKYNEYNTTNRRTRRFIGCHSKGSFTFNSNMNFEKIVIKRTRFSSSVQIEGEYRERLAIKESIFNNTIRVNNAEFRNGCNISENIFRGEIHISNITVTGEMRIKSVELPLKFIISESDIENLKLNAKKGLPSLVDVREGTEILAGSLMNTETADIYYDLSYARIGDIHIDLNNSNWKNYLFTHTHFTDFKFIDYEDKIRENGYKIHEFGYSDDLFYESRVFPDGMFSQSDKYVTSSDLEKGISPSYMLFFEENERSSLSVDCLLESVRKKVPFLHGDKSDGKYCISMDCLLDSIKQKVQFLHGEKSEDTWFPADIFLEDVENAERVIPSEDYKSKTALRNQTETYTQAKNHAQSNGVGTLVSGFHVLQNRAERAKYASRSRSASSIRDKVLNRIRSFQNGFLRWLYKYGEGTYYPLFWSVSTIVLAALLYLNIELIRGEPTTTTIFGVTFIHNSLSTWIESFQYSVVIFTSLGSNSVTPQTLIGGTLVSAQSILGAILIALFVFTLGRQASR